jgi:hypothetical protein
MRQVRFDKEAFSFIVELANVLLHKDYFSFYETADTYVQDLVNYVTKNIHTTPHKIAPIYFSKYGNNLFYMSYHRNQHTTWYIFFEKTTQHLLVRHISNNHVIGKYL